MAAWAKQNSEKQSARPACRLEHFCLKHRAIAEVWPFLLVSAAMHLSRKWGIVRASAQLHTDPIGKGSLGIFRALGVFPTRAGGYAAPLAVQNSSTDEKRQIHTKQVATSSTAAATQTSMSVALF